jgi:hypothetical protein
VNAQIDKAGLGKGSVRRRIAEKGGEWMAKSLQKLARWVPVANIGFMAHDLSATIWNLYHHHDKMSLPNSGSEALERLLNALGGPEFMPADAVKDGSGLSGASGGGEEALEAGTQSEGAKGSGAGEGVEGDASVAGPSTPDLMEIDGAVQVRMKAGRGYHWLAAQLSAELTKITGQPEAIDGTELRDRMGGAMLHASRVYIFDAFSLLDGGQLSGGLSSEEFEKAQTAGREFREELGRSIAMDELSQDERTLMSSVVGRIYTEASGRKIELTGFLGVLSSGRQGYSIRFLDGQTLPDQAGWAEYYPDVADIPDGLRLR